MMAVIGAPVYQWESGRKMRIATVEGRTVQEVYFSYSGDKEALVVIPRIENGSTVVDIPNILLQDYGNMLVYSSCIVDDCEETEFNGVFYVRPRPKPADYLYTETEVLSYKTLYDLIIEIEKNGVSDKQIEAAVIKYLKENQIDTGPKLTIGYIELLADKWVGAGNLYSQVVTIDGVTPYSQVDLTPSVEQLVVFYEKDLTLLTENDGGVVTVYAIGQRPENDYTMQVTIKEVAV